MVQGLTTIPKAFISLVVVLLSGLILILLWQKPARVAAKDPLLGSTTQNGAATSTGQTGGVTAGLYINQVPPVTDQQKADALLQIQSEIEELSTFRDRPDIPEPRTLLERISVDTTPHQLFIILNKYYKDTIKNVPNIGANLYKFKLDYYNFEKREYDFESECTRSIGKYVKVQFSHGWSIYFRYFMLRAAGLSQRQIIEGGNFLNYGITWEDAEDIFNKLMNDDEICKKVTDNVSMHTSMRDSAQKIVKEFDGQ